MPKQSVRRAAVAGTFYPAAADALQATVQELISCAKAVNMEGQSVLKALIVPHAGYMYSGPVAATAYCFLRTHQKHIKRIAILGPAHRVHLNGIALPQERAFATPMGLVEVDESLTKDILQCSSICVNSEAHVVEHSIEVQLPLLMQVLKDFTFLPLLVGDASFTDVKKIILFLLEYPDVCVVVSSDLSHYLSYQEAQSVDEQTSTQILSLAASLTYKQACGWIPINGLLLAAKENHLRSYVLDLRNSGDTSDTKIQVVGYGAFAFMKEDEEYGGRAG